MYRTHFGLTGFPFDKDIPADELFVSAAMAPCRGARWNLG